MTKLTEDIEDDGYDYWINFVVAAIASDDASSKQASAEREAKRNSIDVGSILAGREAKKNQEQKTKNLITAIIILVILVVIAFTVFTVIKNK